MMATDARRQASTAASCEVCGWYAGLMLSCKTTANICVARRVHCGHRAVALGLGPHTPRARVLLPAVIAGHHAMLPNQAIASTPSAPRPSGAEGRGSTAPLCLQLLRTSQACTRYSAILLEITRHLPLLPQISSDTKRNNLVEASFPHDKSLESIAILYKRPARTALNASLEHQTGAHQHRAVAHRVTTYKARLELVSFMFRCMQGHHVLCREAAAQPPPTGRAAVPRETKSCNVNKSTMHY
jgi:hypothetical protein